MNIKKKFRIDDFNKILSLKENNKQLSIDLFDVISKLTKVEISFFDEFHIEKGIEKLQVTAREASKQSRRLFIPEVTDVANTSKVVESIAQHDLVLVFHESATNKVSEIVTRKYYESQNVMIIIGPEGGITNEELELFKSAGAKVALMGRPILRSAHAGLAAMSAVNALIKVW